MLNRRNLLIAGLAVITVGGIWYVIDDRRVFGEQIDAPVALKLAKAGDIFLIDIRRPDEWAKTKIASVAHPIDMRDGDFIDQLVAVVNNDRDAAVAIICAAGVRSRRMQRRLLAAGFSNIINVPEGMTGSKAGPGWVKRGLPLREVP